jgi:hypothetical protein
MATHEKEAVAQRYRVTEEKRWRDERSVEHGTASS